MASPLSRLPDIPLSISTAVIASIALGLGVDEAIHLLTEFDQGVRVHADQRRAVVEAMQSVGPPVVYATTALSIGFLVPAFSGFVPVRQCAWLSATNVFISLLADLFLLPAAMASVRSSRSGTCSRSGSAASHTGRSPPFRGLRSSQARIAALLGQLRAIGTGERIVTQGETEDAMYVLIEGSAEVRRAGPGPYNPREGRTRGHREGDRAAARRAALRRRRRARAHAGADVSRRPSS